MKLPNAKSALMSANNIPPLNSDQLSIWKNIANITTKTEVDTLCYQIRLKIEFMLYFVPIFIYLVVFIQIT